MVALGLMVALPETELLELALLEGALASSGGIAAISTGLDGGGVTAGGVGWLEGGVAGGATG
jgi:hypothetical protein